MSRPIVYITRPLHSDALALIGESATARVWPEDSPVPRHRLLEAVAECSGLLCMLSDRVDDKLLSHAPGLKVVSNYAVGYDNIDLRAAAERGVVVGNTPGVLSGATADLAFALLLAVARNVVKGDGYVRGEKWKTWHVQGLVGQEVHGAILGIIGMGRIGQEMARRGRGFNMRIIYASRSSRPEAEQQFGARRVPLNELLSISDFVSLHCPLTSETRHLIAAREIALMKPTATLINTARGSIVDQPALVDALRAGKIWGAGLDVFENEPIAADDPLLALSNVVLAPHIGSASAETRREMAMVAARNLLAGLKGDPLPFPVT